MTLETTHPARQTIDELLKQCAIRHERRRGPGGQHRNKTESAVVIRHVPTGIEGQAAERRSQADNHRNAIKRLRIQLALGVRSESPAELAPSELWRSRCPGGKISCREEHADFPALLAEALDVVVARGGNVNSSAEQLGCTVTQLVKFLAKEPRALSLVNDIRRRAGLPPRSV